MDMISFVAGTVSSEPRRRVQQREASDVIDLSSIIGTHPPLVVSNAHRRRQMVNVLQLLLQNFQMAVQSQGISSQSVPDLPLEGLNLLDSFGDLSQRLTTFNRELDLFRGKFFSDRFQTLYRRISGFQAADTLSSLGSHSFSTSTPTAPDAQAVELGYWEQQRNYRDRRREVSLREIRSSIAASSQPESEIEGLIFTCPISEDRFGRGDQMAILSDVADITTDPRKYTLISVNVATKIMESTRKDPMTNLPVNYMTLVTLDDPELGVLREQASDSVAFPTPSAPPEDAVYAESHASEFETLRESDQLLDLNAHLFWDTTQIASVFITLSDYVKELLQVTHILQSNFKDLGAIESGDTSIKKEAISQFLLAVEKDTDLVLKLYKASALPPQLMSLVDSTLQMGDMMTYLSNMNSFNGTVAHSRDILNQSKWAIQRVSKRHRDRLDSKEVVALLLEIDAIDAQLSQLSTMIVQFQSQAVNGLSFFFDAATVPMNQLKSLYADDMYRWVALYQQLVSKRHGLKQKTEAALAA